MAFAKGRKIHIARITRVYYARVVAMEIMKTSRTLSSAVCLLASVALANTSAVASDLVLHKVPPLSPDQAPGYPQNLARYHLGAQVEAAPRSQSIAQLKLSTADGDNNAAEAALLCDDPTVGYALPAGTTTLLVALPKVENVGSISFLNDGVNGDVAVSFANAKLPANSPQWQTVVQQPVSAEAIRAEVIAREVLRIRRRRVRRERRDFTQDEIGCRGWGACEGN